MPNAEAELYWVGKEENSLLGLYIHGSYTGLEKRKIHYWVYISMESAKILPVENSTFLNTFKILCEVIINFTQVLFKGRQALSVKSYSLLKHYTYLCSWNKFPGFRAQSPWLEVSSINI